MAVTSHPSSPSPSELADQAARLIAERSGVDRHDVGLVLGSGWGAAADLLGETVCSLAAPEVPGFSAPAVDGHVGTVRSVRIGETGRHALVLGARRHLYEGSGVDSVVHGVRAAAATGVGTMVLTNGSGGLNPRWAPGTPVLINDHINLTAVSPLVGPTFVDLTDLYTPSLRELARHVDPELPEGVYAQLPGPHYETPAEIDYLRTIGADLVGMSTALEAIAARASGLDVLGLSLVTNAAAGTGGSPLSHAEVIEAGRNAGPRISALLVGIVTRIAEHG